MTLDPLWFSALAHRHLTFCGPVNETRLNELISLLNLPAGAHVVDAGCGKGELLIRLAERYRVQALGVDLSPHFIEIAATQANRRAPHLVEMRTGDMLDHQPEPGSLALAVCIGSTHIFGSYQQTLDTLIDWVQPGGQILVGDLFWQKDPDPAFLEALGAQATDYTNYAGLITAGIERDLIPLFTITSSAEDWETYEWCYLFAAERYAADHPDDPRHDAILARARAGRDRYLRWGRETFGFAVCLFRKPAASR